MKNLLWIYLLLLCGVLLACNNESTNSTNKQEKEQTNNEVNEDIKVEKKEIKQEKIVEIPEATYKINEKTWSIEPIDEQTNEKVVLLTIDDAPDKYALNMAKTLKELDAKAIFFVNGHFLETTEEKEILKEIYEMGFLIGNHTYSHASLPDLSNDEQKDEIIRVNDMVEEVIGERPKFFRAPFGQNTDFSKQLAEDEEMLLMNWSYGYDWDKEYMSKEAITEIMINTELLRNGANLLMHDREWTAAALGDIVTGLRDKGYEFVDPTLIQTNAEREHNNE